MLNEHDISSYAKHRRMHRLPSQRKKKFVQYEMSNPRDQLPPGVMESNYNESVMVNGNPEAFEDYRYEGRSSLRGRKSSRDDRNNSSRVTRSPSKFPVF